jgi:hypothetical protein
MRLFAVLIASSVLGAASFALEPSTPTVPMAEGVADANGNLHVPEEYRTLYQSLGSWAIAADEGKGSKELHVVYASPGAIAAYRKDGHFPDGAVLVKEVHEAATA